MLIGPVLRGDPLEIGLEVAVGGRRSVLLDEQRSGSVPAEQGDQPVGDALPARPFEDLLVDVGQPLAARADGKRGGCLAHGRPPSAIASVLQPHSCAMLPPMSSSVYSAIAGNFGHCLRAPAPTKRPWSP